MDILAMVEQFQQMQQELQLLKRKVAQIENQPLALEWVTEEQACLILHRSRGTVREYARRGKVRAEKRGGRVLYHVQSMRDFLSGLNYTDQYIEQSLDALRLAS